MHPTHRFDQVLAEADATLDAFLAEYPRSEAQLGEVDNLVMLEESLTKLPPTAIGPLLAVAIRRLSKQVKP